jgi:hypothetical protein
MLLKKTGLLTNDLVFVELYDTGVIKYYIKY